MLDCESFGCEKRILLNRWLAHSIAGRVKAVGMPAKQRQSAVKIDPLWLSVENNEELEFKKEKP